MLSKAHYEVLKRHTENMDDAPRSVVNAILDEYELANPPAPVVKCPACGRMMKMMDGNSYWVCQSAICMLTGPYNDPTGAKVMALGRKPLPIKPPFVVWNNKAYPFIDHACPKVGQLYLRGNEVWIAEHSMSGPTLPILGDPIDIGEWFK